MKLRLIIYDLIAQVRKLQAENIGLQAELQRERESCGDEVYFMGESNARLSAQLREAKRTAEQAMDEMQRARQEAEDQLSDIKKLVGELEKAIYWRDEWTQSRALNKLKRL